MRVTRLRLGDLAGRRAAVLRRPVTREFSAVGVTWAHQPRRAEVSVAVRVLRRFPLRGVPREWTGNPRRGGGWTGWRTAEAAERGREGTGAGRARDGADLLWWGPAVGLEIAVRATAGPAPRDVTVDLIDPGQRPGDAAPTGPPGAAPEAPERAAASPYLRPRVPMPTIYSRARWGANERKMGWTPEYVSHVKAAAIHHTVNTNRYTAAQVPRILRSIYHFHAVSRGWGDIGYNVLVDRFGRLWEGRTGGLSRPVVGAHSGGYNSFTTGVAFIGDHRRRNVPPRARAAAARFMAWKFSLSPAFHPRGRTALTGGGYGSRYKPGTTITVYRIHGHRRTNPTSCPGGRGVAALPGLRQRTAALLGGWTRPTAMRARLTFWRPSTASWYVRGVPGPALRGSVGDLPVLADFDGDGVQDLTTWTPATAVWTVWLSRYQRVVRWTLGAPSHRPVPADTDGDGRAEPMTWDPATSLWHRRGLAPLTWGGRADDVPVPADYDGDGRADLAVWRPATGGWLIRRVGTVTLGDSWHIPVPADYDGDGDTDPATWSPGTGRFLMRGRPAQEFGPQGGVPVPGQYDGDPAAELAVWGMAGEFGRWQIEGIGAFDVGTEGDQPLPAS